MHRQRVKQRHQSLAGSPCAKQDILKQRSLLYPQQLIFTYPNSKTVNIRMLMDRAINLEEEDIIFLNSAKKFNESAGQCLIGLAFAQPDSKAKF
jgi:hypothetical protein